MVYKTEIQLIMKFKNFALLAFIIALGTAQAFAQCGTWNELDNKEYLEGQHSVYRSLLKTNDYAKALPVWKEVYEAAPAADGKRDFHYTDGIKMYMSEHEVSTDESRKTELSANIQRLYDEAANCYEQQAIFLSKCGDNQDCYNKRIGWLMGRKGYDMYYQLRAPYEDNLQAFQKAVDLGGNDVEYIVFAPYGAITVYQFQQGAIDKVQAREVHRTLNEIAEYNIANNEKYGAAYKQAIDAMNGSFVEIEKDIFDCDYFKSKYEDDYRDNPDPETAKNLYNLLKLRGCPTDDSDLFMVELKETYEVWAAEENAKKKAEYEANNPAILASKAYKAGNFPEALSKYQEAIASETDAAKKAQYHFSRASIMFRKLKQYNQARTEARTAIQLNPNYGNPYSLIGDMYATTARSCGDSWNQRLAILAAVDKYNKAASLDPSIADRARDKATKYRASFPPKDEGFMRGAEEGQSAKVGCWIGETVKIRFSN
jgi:tetratricopeptide (TPR) repeat protein